MKFHRIAAAMLAAGTAAPVAAAPPTAQAAQSATDPGKQALAARVAASLWPDGTYGRMVDSMVGGGKDGLADMFLDMRPADLMGAMVETMVGDGKPMPDAA